MFIDCLLHAKHVLDTREIAVNKPVFILIELTFYSIYKARQYSLIQKGMI